MALGVGALTAASARPAAAQRPPTSVVQDALSDPGVVAPGPRGPQPGQPATPGADAKRDKARPGGLPLFPLRLRWSVDLDGPPVAGVASDNVRLYLPGQDGAVTAVAVATGEVIWTRAIGGAIVSVAPLGPRVYVASTDNYFYCLDDKQGRVRWRWRAGADAVGTAIADDERVYFAALDGLVRALDRGHGAQRWRQALPWRPRTGPLRVGQTLVASGIALDLRGYALATGAPVGEFALSESRLEVLEGAPVVVARTTLPGDFLVAAIADGRLVALEHVFGLPGRPLTDLPGERVALTPPPPSE